MFKRAVDITFAALLLGAALPLLVLAAIAIRLESCGPVIFRQARMGRGFRQFSIFKLRTMKHSAAGLSYTLGPDARITRVGRLLRRSKVDELPQLWNVLRGDMSIVGPRPVVPELAYEFRDSYRQLLDVRPGLTDPATVKYCRETEILGLAADPLDYFKNVVTPDKIRISRGYLLRANVWTDLAVMTATAMSLFGLIRPRALQLVQQADGQLSWIPVYPIGARRSSVPRDSSTISGVIEFGSAAREARHLFQRSHRGTGRIAE